MEQPARLGHGTAPTWSGEQHAGALVPSLDRPSDATQIGTPGLRWEWEKAMRGAGLRPNLRLFLMVLATYMDGDGNDCFPTAQKIADDLDVERATVFALKKEAEVAGWLTVVSKGGVGQGGGSGKTNRYLPRIPEDQQSGGHPTVANGSEVTNSQVATGFNRQVAARRNQTKDQTSGEPPTPSDLERVRSLLAENWPGRISQKRHVEPLLALLESGWTWDEVVDVVTARTTGDGAPRNMTPFRMRLERLAHCPTYGQAMHDSILLGYLGRFRKQWSPHSPVENGSSVAGTPDAFEDQTEPCHDCGSKSLRGWRHPSVSSEVPDAV